MKIKSLFREKLSHPEILAIHPKAIGVEYDVVDPKENERRDAIAIVNISGPLEHHHSWCWDSYDSILERLEEAFADDDVRAVVMCIDSPGGDASGATEAHRKIQRLKKKYAKKLYAYSDEAMYSAAYSIGSAADEIWVPETGGVGSVGVICMVLDKTKQNEMLGLNVKLLTTGARKADSHPDRELTEDVVSSIQERVDYLGDVFISAVAKARGKSPKEIRALEANTFMGQQAVDSGLADQVGGWYSFLDYVGANLGGALLQSSPETKTMKTLAQLQKERAAIGKKLAAAETAGERKKLMAAYETACAAIADMQAKTKYVKKVEEREESDDSEEDEEATDAADEESEDMNGDGEDDDSDDEGDDDGDEEKAAKAAAALKSLSRKEVSKLLAVLSKFTGTSDKREIFGTLEGMPPVKKAVAEKERLAARVAELERERKSETVSAMLEKAMGEGRVTKAQAKVLREKGLEDPKWLKGYLAAQPKAVRTLEDGPMVPQVDGSAPSLAAQGLTADQVKILQAGAAAAGKSLDDWTKDVERFAATKSNGMAPKL